MIRSCCVVLKYFEDKSKLERFCVYSQNVQGTSLVWCSHLQKQRTVFVAFVCVMKTLRKRSNAILKSIFLKLANDKIHCASLLAYLYTVVSLICFNFGYVMTD